MGWVPTQLVLKVKKRGNCYVAKHFFCSYGKRNDKFKDLYPLFKLNKIYGKKNETKKRILLTFLDH